MNGFDFTTHNIGSTRIYLLRYEPFDPIAYFDKLTTEEQERCLGFAHPRRRCEFVATRLLRHEVFGFQHILYNVHGAPYIENGPFISISHCKNTVAIAVNDSFAVGLDLETPRASILTAMHKFLSVNERKHFDCSDAMVVSKIWSAKEALYKLAGRNGIIFSDDLHLEMRSETEWHGRIINPDHEILVNLNIFEWHGIIISINTAPIEYIA